MLPLTDGSSDSESDNLFVDYGKRNDPQKMHSKEPQQIPVEVVYVVGRPRTYPATHAHRDARTYVRVHARTNTNVLGDCY